MCVVVMFEFSNSIVINIESKGVCEVLCQVIEEVDKEKALNVEFLCNTVIAGGNTMFHNSSNRISSAYDEYKKRPFKVRDVIAPLERKYSAWIGGSILASISTFEPTVVKKKEYDECGSTVWYRRTVR
jgi:actin-related protein